jgi:nitrogen fixation-related uncharacterized protein
LEPGIDYPASHKLIYDAMETVTGIIALVVFMAGYIAGYYDDGKSAEETIKLEAEETRTKR